MRIVLDTNVLVSGLLSPYGPPGHVVRLVASGEIRLCFDARILSEYEEVLARERFGFDPDAVEALLAWIEYAGEMVPAGPLTVRLPDPDDEPFLEVAIAAGEVPLVSGNTAHFAPHARGDVEVLTPAEFAERLRSGWGPSGS